MLGFDPLSTAPLSTLAFELAHDAGVPLDLDSVAPLLVADVGGSPLVISGTFISGLAGFVELIGPVGVMEVHRCYAARRGQGYAPVPRNGGTFIVATPPLAFGSYDLRVVQGAQEGTLPHVINVVPRTWEPRTFEFRALSAPLAAVGPRKLSRQALLLPGGELVLPSTANASGNVGILFTLPTGATSTLPYYVAWTASGTLPPGLSCDPDDGSISGVPTTPGVFTGLQRTATWVLGSMTSNTFSITIT